MFLTTRFDRNHGKLIAYGVVRRSSPRSIILESVRYGRRDCADDNDDGDGPL